MSKFDLKGFWSEKDSLIGASYDLSCCQYSIKGLQYPQLGR